MRFLLDEDVNPGIAEIARGLGLDVVSIHEIARHEISDEEQLRFSTSQGRIFVTRNRDDFLNINLAFFQTGEPHAGILIVPWSLPNKRPERIAHALKYWEERSVDPGLSFIAYLSS
jgi:predicted nuclease of predicted toxin-antitoxin system